MNGVRDCYCEVSDELFRDVCVHRSERNDGHTYHMRTVFLNERGEDSTRTTDGRTPLPPV